LCGCCGPDIIYFLVWTTTRDYLAMRRFPECTSATCVGVGFFDDYKAEGGVRQAKMYLSVCVCLQLLKVMKIAAMLIPKMGLAPSVLKKALPDLIFFGAVFSISVFAFSNMLMIQLGATMVSYNGPFSSFISLGRALFGDFDLDEILENSPDFTNTIFFLAYLFCAVFILLSMFLAILGEAQANLRDDERSIRKEAEKKGETLPPDYGVLTSALQMVVAGAEKLPLMGPQLLAKKAEAAARAEEAQEAHEAPGMMFYIDRLEGRQLEISDKLDAVSKTLQAQVLHGPDANEANSQQVELMIEAFLRELTPHVSRRHRRREISSSPAMASEGRPVPPHHGSRKDRPPRLGCQHRILTAADVGEHRGRTASGHENCAATAVQFGLDA